LSGQPQLLRFGRGRYLLEIDELETGRLVASSRLTRAGVLAVMALGAGGCLGLLLLWHAVQTPGMDGRIAAAVSGGVLGAAGLALLVFGIGLISYHARVTVASAGLTFTRTFFWLTRTTALDRAASMWVTCVLAKGKSKYSDAEVRNGRFLRDHLRVILHVEGPVPDLALRTVALEFQPALGLGGGEVVNYPSALEEMLSTADRIARALDIEHRPNWWQGEDAAAAARSVSVRDVRT
jgi:hypothetical protein